MKPLRACPICPKCGSKRFTRIPDESVKVKCRICNTVISIGQIQRKYVNIMTSYIMKIYDLLYHNSNKPEVDVIFQKITHL